MSVILALSLFLLLRATTAFAPPNDARRPPTPPTPRGPRSRRAPGRGREGAGSAPPARAVVGRDGARLDGKDGDPQRGGGRPPPGAAAAPKPRLASALEIAIRRVAAPLLVKSCGSLEINVRASSNRSLLRGDVAYLSASARDVVFRFGILSAVGGDCHRSRPAGEQM